MKGEVQNIFLGLILSIGLSGCSDPVKDDLLNYINEDLKELGVLEEEALAEYASVTGDNYVDDLTTYTHIEEVVIPLYSDFLEQLEEIDPETGEVKEVHEQYIKAGNPQNNAFIKILAALEEQNYDLVAEANEMLAEGRTEIRSFKKDLGKLAKEHNVKLTE